MDLVFSVVVGFADQVNLPKRQTTPQSGFSCFSRGSREPSNQLQNNRLRKKLPPSVGTTKVEENFSGLYRSLQLILPIPHVGAKTASFAEPFLGGRKRVQ